MKWYSHRAYRIHVEDMKHFKDDQVLRSAYQDWAKVISNRFDRSYTRIGVLNLQDLLQEGYVGFYKAWPKINWKMIADSPEPERIGMITNYLKLSIKRHIQRAIARDRDTIRIPEEYYKVRSGEHMGKIREYQTDIFLTQTFADFFNEEYIDFVDDSSSYLADQTNEFLNDIMNVYMSSLEKMVIKMFYGMDEAYDKPVSQKRIAEYCSKNIDNIKKIKQRGLDKLKSEHVKEIIKNYIDNEVTF